MKKIFKAPTPIAPRVNFLSIFLAGSIELGKAEDWQTRAETMLTKQNINVFNPRRDDWDSSWKQEIQDPQFYQQVSWELNALDKADFIIMYFSPGTKSRARGGDQPPRRKRTEYL